MNFHDSLGRVFGLPVIDILGTGVIAYGISYKYEYSFLTSFTSLFIIGEITHVAMKQKTPITSILFDL